MAGQRTPRNAGYPQAGLTRSSTSHALVIGASMAGLLAGRVLADYFEQVTIVDRDRLPEQPMFRKGTPQGHHVHPLLKRGQIILEQLFPGLEAELAAAGAPVVDWTADVWWFNSGGWKPRFPSGITTRTCSRALLEWSLRQRLANYPRVRFLEACYVTNLLANANKTRVIGVRVRSDNTSQLGLGSEAELLASLVVDASGRNSQASNWLKTLGYPSPYETVVNSFLGYASRCYHYPKDFQADWKVLMQQATPPTSSRGAMLLPIEGDRWILTLAGAARDYPPTDEAAFLDFAHSLPSPILYKAIKDAQPLSPIYGYRRTENRLRHYEQLSHWPENFVVLGDAVCAFNPVYAQGMTVTAEAALTLQQCLRLQCWYQPSKDLRGFSQAFQKKLAKVNTIPWLLATSEDFRYPTTEGSQPDWLTHQLHRYMNQAWLSATHRPQVYKRLMEVLHLLKPPRTLFNPGILGQVLGQVINQSMQNKPHISEKVLSN